MLKVFESSANIVLPSPGDGPTYTVPDSGGEGVMGRYIRALILEAQFVHELHHTKDKKELSQNQLKQKMPQHLHAT
jgi:hypothetical protein